jgi:hypothetical protein
MAIAVGAAAARASVRDIFGGSGISSIFQGSSVAQSTAGNAELEQCVASRVRGWQFPKPKGGGHVVVTYPFLFKQAGE